MEKAYDREAHPDGLARLSHQLRPKPTPSRYQHGILSDKEMLVRHFQDHVREHIPAATRLEAP